MMTALIETGRASRIDSFPCKLGKNEKVLAISTYPEIYRLQMLRCTPPIEGDGYVYLMYDRRTKLIKIGYSRNPEYRERTLQSDNPMIDLLATFRGDRRAEKRLHNKFKSRRVRGEWFDLQQSHIEKIEYDLHELLYHQNIYTAFKSDSKAVSDDVPTVTFQHIDTSNLGLAFEF